MRPTSRPHAARRLALLAAVLLHAALAIALVRQPAGLPGQDGAPPQGHPPGLRFRLVSQLSSPLADEGQRTATSDQATAQTSDAAQASLTPQASIDAEADRDDSPAQAGQGARDTYFGREDLDQGPKALSRIHIDYPEGVPENELQAGRLTLFIDERGAVRRIVVLDQSLPPPFQEAARNAFLQTRFAPAERAGRIVRPRIDVEVVFDARASRMVGARRTDAPT